MNAHPEPRQWKPTPDESGDRLSEIERVLKFDPCRAYRREVIREYHDIHDAIEKAKNNG